MIDDPLYNNMQKLSVDRYRQLANIFIYVSNAVKSDNAIKL